MTTNSDEAANRLGALALRVSDLVEAAVTDAGARSLSAATALSALDRFLDRPTVGQLSDVLGLSTSATVRLVDGLVADAHLKRVPGTDDARQSILELTSTGRRVAKRIVAARTDVLRSSLDVISLEALAAFAEQLDRVLTGLVKADTADGWMCRLCDTETCGAEKGEPCPITKKALGLND